MSEALRESVQGWADDLSRRVDAMYDGLEELARLVPLQGDRAPRREDLRALREPLVSFVRSFAPLCDGAGVAFAPGVLVDADLWLEWWRVEVDGEGFQPHTFNRNAIGFYDYTEMSWYRTPASTGAAGAVGPYLDSGGIDQRIVTLTAPVVSAGEVRAIVGCDLSLAALERSVVRAVGSRESIVVRNATGKVLVSTVPSLAGVGMSQPAVDAASESSVAIPIRRAGQVWQVIFSAF